MKNIVDLQDKHILILGASSEIGIKTAETICKLGARVDIADNDIDLLNSKIRELKGNNNHCFKINLLDIEDIDKTINYAVNEYGKYDGLLYAGVCAYSNMIFEIDMEKIKNEFDINCFGFLESVKIISMDDMHNDNMRIVGISSISTLKGVSSFAGYAGSKAAIDSAIKSLAIELSTKGICINTVASGFINNKMYDMYMDLIGKDSIRYQVLQERQASGIGDPQDIANVIAFLLSDASRFITGQCVVADGGYSA